MGKTTTSAKITGTKARRPAKLIFNGVEIQRPPIAPHTPLARIRRAARIAVRQYAHDLSAAG
jgi:hypothetical protein